MCFVFRKWLSVLLKKVVFYKLTHQKRIYLIILKFWACLFSGQILFELFSKLWMWCFHHAFHVWGFKLIILKHLYQWIENSNMNKSIHTWIIKIHFCLSFKYSEIVFLLWISPNPQLSISAFCPWVGVGGVNVHTYSREWGNWVRKAQSRPYWVHDKGKRYE